MFETLNHSQQLWLPGQELVVPPVAISPEQFRQHFNNAVLPDSTEIVTPKSGFVALRKPNKTPDAVAFLDIDDLLGSLSTTLRRVMYTEDQDAGEKDAEGRVIREKHVRLSYHDYGEGLFFADQDATPENKKQETQTKQSLIRLVKNEFGLMPDEHIDEIGEIVAAWRRSGVYVVAITSAVEGTELSAVDFLGKHFKYNCDGIVITSGDYQMADKGKAALDVMKFIGVTANTPAVHIDDLIFNTSKVRAALQGREANAPVATFQPKFASHFDYDPGSIHADTSLGSFWQAHIFLEQRIGDMDVMPTVRELTQLGSTALAG